MLKYFKITIGILLTLSASRFLPHPPNFTSLIALSFYIPAVLGSIYIFPVVLCYFLTDLFLGIHQVVFFTWGSIILIGVLSKYFVKSFYTRIMGSFFGACLFFLLTNFGVWVTGMYEYSINGLITSYILALPFFYHTIVSTIFFSLIIEFILRIFNFGKKSVSSL